MSDNFDARSPCNNCPYRKDAPREHWHRAEFVKLKQQDGQEFGALYGCHKNNGNPCIGWLLNQRARNVPCISLRMRLIAKPEALTQFEEANDGGHEMFSSINAMCRANRVRDGR